MAARRSEDKSGVVITVDGKEIRLAYSGGMFAADGFVPVGVGGFRELVGRLITSLV